MNRINIYDNDGNFEGWFDLDASKEIASLKNTSGAYQDGRILRVTAKGKLIINEWSNCGKDIYRFASKQREIAEILSCICSDQKLNKKLDAILSKYEM